MARNIPSEAVHYGRNRDLNQHRRDDRFVRCSKCRFICHLDRDRRAPCDSKVGDGIKYVDLSVLYDDSNPYDDQTTIYDGYENVKDPVVFMGCPQCGSLLYDKEEC
jgi:ssDNA-binding Zn-finger/Zn-ribbon topoisomerase 1